MTKSETLKQLAAASNAARLDKLGQGIEALHSARIENVEQLASMLEPLAQAMAALTDETRQTLTEIEQQGRDQAERFKSQVEAATKALTQASTQAQQAASNMDAAARQTEWRHYLLVVITGLLSGLLVSALWLWQARYALEAEPSIKGAAVVFSPETPPRKRSNVR
ncbi:relaxasome subunit MobB [Pseudoduganella lurida]|uniref:Relaxasome subunit MobB n=1 Tax=Pseudoduganella lurida TaxID=1036180 RepID=A0A562R8L6_9BURK|nr:relaxasome subunit MobB [Pseudoduganella lurida]